jgi:beta-glucosidase
LISSVTTAVKELKGFQRIHFNAGESKRASFDLKPEDLSLWNRKMERVVEAGKFRIMVGKNTEEGMSDTFTVESLIKLKN